MSGVQDPERAESNVHDQESNGTYCLFSAHVHALATREHFRSARCLGTGHPSLLATEISIVSDIRHCCSRWQESERVVDAVCPCGNLMLGRVQRWWGKMSSVPGWLQCHNITFPVYLHCTGPAPARVRFRRVSLPIPALSKSLQNYGALLLQNALSGLAPASSDIHHPQASASRHSMQTFHPVH